jgi:hypothetical protein
MSDPDLYKALEGSTRVLQDARRVLFRWLEGRELSERAALDQLIALLDGPEARQIENRSRLALGQSPMPANDAGNEL